jgi:hypothetical protein
MHKTYRLVTLISILVTIGVTVWLYTLKYKIQHTRTSLSQTINVLRLKSRADSLYILGQLDQSLSLYQQYDSLTGDSLKQIRQSVSVYNKSVSNRSNERSSFSLLKELEYIRGLLKKCEEGSTEGYLTLISQTSETDQNAQLTERLNQLKAEVDRLKNNQGVVKFISSKNGSVTYFGDLQSGKANGNGIGHWLTGSHYEGEWKDNLRHGNGIFIWADGEKYEGHYKNDLRSGYGVYTAKAGKYEGEWLDDMRHGEGYLYEPSGKLKVHGVWEKDKLVKTIK